MITSIRAQNCLAFTAMQMEIAPDGAIIEGGNGKGKTSILRMVRAALTAHGVSEDMIRKGATSAEIIVSLDSATVRRALTMNGDKFRTTLKVTDVDGKLIADGASFLKNLLGLSPLDPIELFMEQDKKKRRAKILSAIPCSVTEAQLATWCPPGARLVDLVGDNGRGEPALSDHGLEVIERARKAVYVQRTDANRVYKERSAAYETAFADEQRIHGEIVKLRMAHGFPIEAPSVAAALTTATEARAAQMALMEQARTAEQAHDKHAKTRERAATLRSKASLARANQPLAPSDEQFAEAASHTAEMMRRVDDAEAVVLDLRAQLAEAEMTYAACSTGLSNAKATEARLSEYQKRAEAAVDEIADLEDQAASLEEAINTLPTAPSQADHAAASEKCAQAAQLLDYAKRVDGLAKRASEVEAARTALKAAEEWAGVLDTSVKRLANEAPAALLAGADGIQGLILSGDDVYLDGVSLDLLSGMERLFFATDITKRANSKGKLVCVDALEQLDREHRKAFIAHATSGGFQLIATRVIDNGGDPVAMPIT